MKTLILTTDWSSPRKKYRRGCRPLVRAKRKKADGFLLFVLAASPLQRSSVQLSARASGVHACRQPLLPSCASRADSPLFFNATAPPGIYTLSLHDALPI